MEWNEDSIARLRGLWAEGHSTAEIGRRLAVSKNAVVGKAHRLGLAARPSPIRRDGIAAPRGVPPRRVVGPTLPPLPAADVPPPGVPPAGVSSVGVSSSVGVPSMGVPEGRAVAGEGVGAASVAAAPPSPLPAMSPPAMSQLLRPGQPAASIAPPAPVAQPAAHPALQAAPAPMRPVPPARSPRSVACCWPIGEPGTKSFRFCDDDALQGKPYCADHAQLAYVKVRDRREEAA